MRAHTVLIGGMWCALWLVRASPLLLNQIGPFMKQSQTGFTNSPGQRNGFQSIFGS